MKIDIKTINENVEPIQLFYSGCKSPNTKSQYTKQLRRVLFEFMEDILNEEAFEARANELVHKANKDPKWIRNVLIAIVSELKKRTQLPREDSNFAKTTIFDSYIPPVKKLLDMNDIPVVWKKIYSLYPEMQSDEDTRGYSRDEIKKMLKVAGAQDSATILIASSSGIRMGAFDFKWKHIRPVYQYNDRLVWEDEDVTESIVKDGKIVCGLVLIYSDSVDKQFGFITPEALDAIQVYKTQWIQDTGYEPKPDNPFLKHDGFIIKPADIKTTWARIRRVVIKTGLRKPLVKGKRRHEVPLMNGFRRFFNKKNKESLSKDSALSVLIKKEVMMGHTGLISLDKNYFKMHMSELVEEYLNAVPNLTISNELRQKLTIEQKNKKITELQVKEKQIDDLQERFEDFKEESLNEIEKLKWTNEIYSIYFETGELPKIETRGDKTRLHFKSLDELKKNSKKDLK